MASWLFWPWSFAINDKPTNQINRNTQRSKGAVTHSLSPSLAQSSYWISSRKFRSQLHLHSLHIFQVITTVWAYECKIQAIVVFITYPHKLPWIKIVHKAHGMVMLECHSLELSVCLMCELHVVKKKFERDIYVSTFISTMKWLYFGLQHHDIADSPQFSSECPYRPVAVRLLGYFKIGQKREALHPCKWT